MKISGCGNDAQFKDLCHLIGEPELAEAKEYKTNEDRVKNRVNLINVCDLELPKYPHILIVIHETCYILAILFTFQIITKTLKQKTNFEWDRIFSGKEESEMTHRNGTQAKFPYGPVNNLAQVFGDPQVKYNKMEMVMEHENVGEIKQVNLSHIIIFVNAFIYI